MSILFHFAVTLAPLVDSLVTCQRLTSLGLEMGTLSLQSLLAVVKGLQSVRALRLEKVSLLHESVSGCVRELCARAVVNQLQCLK